MATKLSRTGYEQRLKKCFTVDQNFHGLESI